METGKKKSSFVLPPVYTASEQLHSSYINFLEISNSLSTSYIPAMCQELEKQKTIGIPLNSSPLSVGGRHKKWLTIRELKNACDDSGFQPPLSQRGPCKVHHSSHTGEGSTWPQCNAILLTGRRLRKPD